jgi:hypothetical protein
MVCCEPATRAASCDPCATIMLQYLSHQTKKTDRVQFAWRMRQALRQRGGHGYTDHSKKRCLRRDYAVTEMTQRDIATPRFVSSLRLLQVLSIVAMQRALTGGVDYRC